MNPSYSDTEDEIYMRRALHLASLSHNEIKTNPNVGAVIVYNGMIIGEGRYAEFGKSHAEVNALKSVAPTNRQYIKDSTIYVTLEPCCYYGKTPPCTGAIIDAGIKRVIVSYIDPNPKIAGQGIQLLKDAGIAVKTDVLAQEGKLMVAPFLAHLNQRPYVILKWAKSSNNIMGHSDIRTSISGALSGIFTHTLRTRVDGIMVASNTAIVDDPALTTRHVNGDSPTRILIDTNLTVSTESKIYNNEAETIVINQLKDSNEINGIRYIKVADTHNIEDVLSKLYECGMHRILVEGGKKLLTSYIRGNHWDKSYVISSQNKIVKDLNAVTAPSLLGSKVESFVMGEDVINGLIPAN